MEAGYQRVIAPYIIARSKARYWPRRAGACIRNTTALDYYRFVQMLLNGGELDGVRLLSPQSVKYMLSDHLGGIRSLLEKVAEHT